MLKALKAHQVWDTLKFYTLSITVKLSLHFVLTQYVRVMPAGGQCYEPGPFFLTIPRHVTRVGISRRRNLLLRPDWLVTGGLLFGAVVVLCLCVTVLVSANTKTHATYTQ